MKRDIKFRARVFANFDSVLKRWDKQLFKAMTPFPIHVEIIQFEGSRKHNGYDILLKLIGKSMRWKGIISNSRMTNSYFVFKDLAIQLPYPLIYWRHTHWIIKKSSSEVLLIDKIQYRCVNRTWGFLVYIPIMIAFYQRMILAKLYFENISFFRN